MDRSQLLPVGYLAPGAQYVLAWNCFVGPPSRLAFQFLDNRGEALPGGLTDDPSKVFPSRSIGRAYGQLPEGEYQLRVELLGDARCSVQVGQQDG